MRRSERVNRVTPGLTTTVGSAAAVALANPAIQENTDTVASRLPDDEPSGLPPEWGGFVVPDDISELDTEIEKLRRELATPRRPRLQRLFETRRFQRYGLSGPLVVVVLLVVLLFASLVFLLVPVPPRSPEPQPLARPALAPGSVGALLPDLALPVGDNGSLRLRTLRPAVVVLLPADCGCAWLVDYVIASTSASRLPVLLVGDQADPRLPSTAPVQRMHAATDDGGRLAAGFRAGPGPTVLFVRADGTVTRVIRNAQPGADIRQDVDALAG